MTDHQQAATEAAAKSLRQIEPNLYQNPYNPQRYYGGLAQDAIAAAEPHLRRKWAEEVLNEGIIGAGYSVLMNPNRGEHPVTTFTRAVKHMLNLLEGATE